MPRKRMSSVQLELAPDEPSRFAISRTSFKNMVRSILRKRGPGLHIQKRAVEALQESAEMYITQMFEDAFRLATHCNRSTLQDKDLRLLALLKSNP